MQSELVSLQEIEGTKSLLPFNRTDVVVLTEWGRQMRKEGGDFSFCRAASQDRDTATCLRAGLLILQSRSIGIEILLIKAKNEERMYRQENLYLSFIGSYSTDRWTQGAASGSLATGLRIIGNLNRPVYRVRSSKAAGAVHDSTKPA